MINSLRHIPIKRKLTLAITIACMATLMLSSGSLFLFHWLGAREAIERDMQTQAEIIGDNSTAALSFGDNQAATEIISALKARPHILGASLYLTNGNRFAFYGRSSDSQISLPRPMPEGFRRIGDILQLYHPVRLENHVEGVLLLQFDYRAMEYDLVMPFLITLVGIALAAFLCALALSSSFQPFISAPILRLAGMARSVAENKDFSLRAGVPGNDEIGELTQAFNGMLDRIQEQDASLRAAGERHERQQKALAALTQGGSLHDDALESSLQRICKTTALTLQVQRTGLWRWNDAYTAMQCIECYDSLSQIHWTGEAVEKTTQEAYFNRFKSEANVVVDNLASELGKQLILEAGLEKTDAVSLLEIPICLNGRIIGVLRHEHTGSPRHWEPDEQLFAAAVANLISMAFGHWERKRTQEALDEVSRQLIDTSRKAGMAEIAAGVIHNVGNILNSVNVSCTLVLDQMRQSRISDLSRLAAMLEAHRSDLGDFLTRDAKGRQIPDYLTMLAPVLEDERAGGMKELESLRDKIDHIKQIVAMQQSYAGISGAIVNLPITQVIDDALTLNAGSLTRHGIQVVRQYEAAPVVAMDKHKVLQILINLIRNAKHACNECSNQPRQVVLRVCCPDPEKVQVHVTDNGIGISAENLTRIFSHGFTTRKDGHGFGLHSGALAAAEMGGSLSVFSDGPGKGAVFTLELPMQAAQ